jgi:hypothetical protein
VPYSGRESCYQFRQGIARFEYACMCLSNSYLQALEDKEERGMLQKFRPEGGESAGEVNEVVCGVSKEF